MKHLRSILLFYLLAICSLAVAQSYNPFYVPRTLPNKDSLKAIIQNPKDPIQKLIALRELGHAYYENKRDSALFYFEQSIPLARSIKSSLWEADACNSIGFVSYIQGNYPRALQFLTQAITLAENENSEKGEWKPAAAGFVDLNIARYSILARSYQHLAVLYGYTGNYSENTDKELYYFNKALAISTRLGDKAMMGIINMNIARHYSFGPHLDSTIFYQQQALQLMNEAGYKRYNGSLMFNLGEAYRRHQQPEQAKACYWFGMDAGKIIENTRSVADNALALANLYQSQANTDSAIFYGRIAADRFKSTLILSGLSDSYASLSSAFKSQNRIDSAYHYQGLSLTARKELDADDKVRRYQQLRFDEQIKAQEAAEKERSIRNRNITSILLAGLAILALIGLFLYRNNLARKKANQLLEEKNRELEIEAALEKIRSRSLAMHKSEELQEVANTVFEQILALHINAHTLTIFVTIENSKDYDCWLQNNEQNYFRRIHFPYVKGNQVSEDHQMNHGDIVTKTYTRSLKDSWFRFMFEHSEMRNIPESRKQYVMNAEYFTASVAQMNYTKIGIYRYSDTAFTESEFNILKRFSQVFEQAYIRFLDLQKAEAQAKESQVEAALERVRSRTMAMQNSEELKDVIYEVYEQFVHLEILVEHAGFIVDYKNRDDMHIWLADPNRVPSEVFVPYFDSPHWNSFNEARATGKDFFSNLLDFEEKNKFYQTLFSFFPLSEDAKEFYLNCPGLAISTVLMDDVALYIENFSGRSYTDEENGMLMRFGKVFQQTYKRFLDLQRAEANTREAQIEAALERIRSRSMAMQKSEELSDLSLELVKQVQALGVATWFCAFNIYDNEANSSVEWGSNGQGVFPKYRTPRENIFLRYYEAGQRGETLLVNEIGKEECPAHYEYLCTLPGVGDQLLDMKAAGIPFPTHQIDHVAFFKYGYLLFITYEPVPETHDIFKRFAKVFEQSYTRFLDLKQAEAQAKESQIQLALERVRARTMAMQKSEELLEAGELLCSEMTRLGIHSLTSGYVLFDEDENIGWNYTPNPGTGKIMPVPVGTIHKETEEMRTVLDYWKSRKPYSVIEMNEAQTIRHQTFIASRSINFPITVEELLAISPPRVVLHNFNFREGYILIVGGERLTDEQITIMLRFANVFQQTYTRFLDLKKAEAQAHEAQIEAALERVRSRSLAMHHTDELQDVVNVAAQQLLKMNIDIDGGMFIAINEEVTHDMPIWAAAGAADYIQKVTVPFLDRPAYTGMLAAIQNRQPFYTEYYSKEEKNEFLNLMFRYPPWNQNSEERKQELLDRDGGYARSLVVNRYTSIGITNHHGKVFSEADNSVLRRFGAVLEQSYTRFLDLQKAEAQAREALIEAALERVRSRTIGMQRSEELKDASMLLFQQVVALNVPAFGCGFNIWDEDRKAATAWMAGQDRLQPPFKTSSSEDIFQRIFKAAQNGELLFVEEQGGESLKAHYEYMNSIPVFKELADKMAANGQSFPTFQIMHCAFFSQGYLMFITFEQVPAAYDIFKRFAKVFEQTYTRYLDLQKAERQAREAQIESALERVRSSAMAMHNSKDLAHTIEVFYHELKSFSFTPIRCGVGLLDQEDRVGEMFTWNTNEKGESLELLGRLRLEGHPVLEEVYQHWLNQEDYFPVLKGREISEYYKVLRPQISFPKHSQDQVQYGNFFFFKEGGVYAWTENEMNAEELQIYKRFTSVLSLTYKRYNDLRKAEASAREAVRQASLDRVRAEIASMRTVEDLQRITPLIWRELTVLSIRFIRCGVFIMDDATQQIHTYLSTPDGEAIASFNLSYTSSANISDVVNYWHQGGTYIKHWALKEFIELADALVQQGFIRNREQYLGSLPEQGIYLHFMPFAQGMLYVGNMDLLGEEDIAVLKAVADTFATAYARYEDFNRLEAAKKQVENTLTDLKQAQKQLIQAEKMASLGELTAGIAHEIQNPLNFVNNFSEINRELLEEVKSQKLKVKNEELEDLLGDILQNNEKILHHGKRADAIVKGMLQHTRSGTGTKEPTDINALCDEYLRLAYHGLRAKDKSFNAAIETDFDPAIGRINVVPQEIGRVVLNLITNAFYAVNEKRKLIGNGYRPEVAVSTRLVNGQNSEAISQSANSLIISVADNGTGIPQKLVDKIFQPFFTTKPTGEGTGLGLSLSYDIIKAHGGDIKLESKEGEGTVFQIVLTNH